VLEPIYRDVPPFSTGDSDLMDLAHTPPAILPETNIPVPRHIFGREPVHDWCYYYEKADLARDLQDWQTVTALQEEATAKGYQPYNGAELLPFIQAKAMQADWEQALALSHQSAQLSGEMNRPICNLWRRLATEGPAGDARQSAVSTARAEFFCPVW
jgi:hypothetical protein